MENGEVRTCRIVPLKGSPFKVSSISVIAVHNIAGSRANCLRAMRTTGTEKVRGESQFLMAGISRITEVVPLHERRDWTRELSACMHIVRIKGVDKNMY